MHNNKNIRKNILELVCNRINPNKSQLTLERSSCQSCLVIDQRVKGTNQKKCIKKNEMYQQSNQKVQKNQFKICEQVFQIKISQEKRKSNYQQAESRSSILNMIYSKEKSKKTQEKSFANPDDDQRTINFILKWLNYALNKVQGRLGSQVGGQQEVESLPFEQNSQLQKIKNTLQKIAQMKKIQARDSLYSQCHTLDQSLFKHSLHTVPLTQANNLKELESLGQKTEKEEKMKNSSKILQSTSTISSENNLMRQTVHAEELIRMLYIQATEIEQHLIKSSSI